MDSCASLRAINLFLLPISPLAQIFAKFAIGVMWKIRVGTGRAIVDYSADAKVLVWRGV